MKTNMVVQWVASPNVLYDISLNFPGTVVKPPPRFNLEEPLVFANYLLTVWSEVRETEVTRLMEFRHSPAWQRNQSLSVQELQHYAQKVVKTDYSWVSLLKLGLYGIQFHEKTRFELFLKAFKRNARRTTHTILALSDLVIANQILRFFLENHAAIQLSYRQFFQHRDELRGKIKAESRNTSDTEDAEDLEKEMQKQFDALRLSGRYHFYFDWLHELEYLVLHFPFIGQPEELVVEFEILASHFSNYLLSHGFIHAGYLTATSINYSVNDLKLLSALQTACKECHILEIVHGLRLLGLSELPGNCIWALRQAFAMRSPKFKTQYLHAMLSYPGLTQNDKVHFCALATSQPLITHYAHF